MDRVPFNRSALNATANGLAGRERGVGAGNSASWMTPDGNTIVDLTPETYLARLTGERIGAAYGWERVHVDCDSDGNIIVGLWTDGDANSGTPTALPAIEPNGATNLRDGAIVKIWPCEQGGTWKYYILSAGDIFGQNSGSGTEAGGGDLTTIVIGPYLTDVTVECVVNSGGQSVIRTTKTWGISTVTGVDLSVVQSAYVPPSGGG